MTGYEIFKINTREYREIGGCINKELNNLNNLHEEDGNC